MHIVITGGSGRVGAAIIDLALAEGHTLTSLDRAAPDPDHIRPGVTYHQVDLTSYDAFLQVLPGAQALIHMAAIPAPGRAPDHEVHNTNVVMSYNALRAAAEAGVWRVCQASSINAIGGFFSRWPKFDYFPLDEAHPCYAEDPYSLSKWICERQADAIARRYEPMRIASLRFHGVVPTRDHARPRGGSDARAAARSLWGYTRFDAVSRASLLSLQADFAGHEVFYITGPVTTLDQPSLQLRDEWFPDVPLGGDLSGNRSFYDCSKAERLLGWTHPPN